MHGLLEAGLEVTAWLPAQLMARFRSVDGVAPIVPRPVGYERDQLAARSPGRPHAVEGRANIFHHRQIGALTVAAEIVALTRPPSVDEGDQTFRMVLDMQPIAHVRAVAVYRQRLAGERLEDGERDELFRELARSVIFEQFDTMTGSP